MNSPPEQHVARQAAPGMRIETTTSNQFKRRPSVEDKSSRRPSRKLCFVVLSLIFAIFVSSFDKVSVSATLPGVARDFGTTTAISRVGTPFLIAE